MSADVVLSMFYFLFLFLLSKMYYIFHIGIIDMILTHAANTHRQMNNALYLYPHDEYLETKTQQTRRIASLSAQ